MYILFLTKPNVIGGIICCNIEILYANSAVINETFDDIPNGVIKEG